MTLTKDELIVAIEAIRRVHCKYLPGMTGSGFCDCKFGGKDINSVSGEQTGCPELRTVGRLLEKMSEKDYQSLFDPSSPRMDEITTRCEGWTRRGGAFSFGPVQWEQCENDAVITMTVIQEGETSEMPACIECWSTALKTDMEILAVVPFVKGTTDEQVMQND